MVLRIAKTAGIARHISPRSHDTPRPPTPSTPACRYGTSGYSPATPTPRTTEHYKRARGNVDRHGVHFLTARRWHLSQDTAHLDGVRSAHKDAAVVYDQRAAAADA